TDDDVLELFRRSKAAFGLQNILILLVTRSWHTTDLTRRHLDVLRFNCANNIASR
ncbi:hypothetical protein D049_1519B, partial [Vibrio parahaemolyticus VPTS-2010]